MSTDAITKAIEAGNQLMAGKFENIDAKLRELEDLQAKGRRPGFGASTQYKGRHLETMSADDERELKGFRTFMRSGDDTDIKALAISTSGGADGGYGMPKVIDQMIEDIVVNISPIRSIAKVIQIGTNDYHKLVDLKGTASGWVAETAARPATATPQFTDIPIKAFELYANPQATQVMLDDVFFNGESWLAGEIAQEFARAEGAGFINGTGTGQPLGFLTGTPVATADGVRAFGVLQYLPTGVAGAFATTMPADVLLSLTMAVKAPFRKNAVWVMSKATLAQITLMKDSSGRFIFAPMQSPLVPQMLWGYPVTEAEDMPAVAASSFSIAFGDFTRGYEIVDRFGTRILRDPFSNKPYIGFYATKRVGGNIVNSEAIKLLKFSVS